MPSPTDFRQVAMGLYVCPWRRVLWTRVGILPGLEFVSGFGSSGAGPPQLLAGVGLPVPTPTHTCCRKASFMCPPPHTPCCRKAFHLSKGDSLAGGFTVEAAQVGHVVKQQNERYEFPSTITLHLAEGASRQQALAAFRAHVREHCIVHSAYGSPYDCSFGPPKLAGGDGVGGGEDEGEDEGGGTVTIACLGKAVRRWAAAGSTACQLATGTAVLRSTEL